MYSTYSYRILDHSVAKQRIQLRRNTTDVSQGNMSSFSNSSQLDGRGHHLIFGHWPEAPWNQFRGKSDQWAGTLAIQLAGVSGDDMLLWVLSIIYIIWDSTMLLYSLMPTEACRTWFLPK